MRYNLLILLVFIFLFVVLDGCAWRRLVQSEQGLFQPGDPFFDLRLADGECRGKAQHVISGCQQYDASSGGGLDYRSGLSLIRGGQLGAKQ